MALALVKDIDDIGWVAGWWLCNSALTSDDGAIAEEFNGSSLFCKKRAF